MMGKTNSKAAKRQKMEACDEGQRIDMKSFPGFGLCTLV
jgi:hypothetical protein